MIAASRLVRQRSLEVRSPHIVDNALRRYLRAFVRELDVPHAGSCGMQHEEHRGTWPHSLPFAHGHGAFALHWCVPGEYGEVCKLDTER